MHDSKLDICAIQECRSKDAGAFEENGYEVYFSGYKRFPKGGAQAGVMLCIRRSNQIEIGVVDYISPRLISIEVKIHGINLLVFSAYVPQNDIHSSDKEKQKRAKDQFWDQIRKHMLKVEKRTKVQPLLLGDFNAHSSAITHGPTFFHGQSIDNIVNNDNGHRLTQFLAEHRLHVASTYFSHKPAHSLTYYSRQNASVKHILDLAVHSKFLQDRCLDSRTKRGYDFGSDHRLVVTRYRFDMKKMKRNKKRKSKPRYDYKGATQQQRQAYTTAVENSDYSDIQSFISNLTTATELTLTKLGKCPKDSYPWNNNPELESLLAERLKYHIKDDRKEYRKMSIRIRKLVKTLRDQHYENEAARFNEYDTRRDIEKSYQIAKQQSTTRRKKLPSRPVPGLSEHFQAHFNHEPPTAAPLILQKPLNKPKVHVVYDTGPPTKLEIETVIRSAKNGKSAIDISMEAVKLATDSPKFVDELTNFYGKIWADRETPKSFSESEITALWKNKGSKSDCSTWRGIMLSSVFTKILAGIILNRIGTAYNLNIGEGQMGFRPKRGCQDGFYCLKGVHQWCRKSQRALFCGMVDLSAAFDWCSRPFIFDSARLIVGDSIMIEILENMYSKTVAWLKNETKKFDCTCGVRQGGTESPVLYNCLAQTCLDTWVDRCNAEGLNKFELPFKIPANASISANVESGFCQVQYLAYCDDLCIFSFDEADLEKKLRLLNDVFKEFGLKMNMGKTETLIYNWGLGKEDIKDYPKSICSIEGVDIKNVQTFKYLGAHSQIDDSSIGDNELQYRITSATCKFFELKNFFTNHSIKLQTRVKFLYSLVRSRLCYLCQGWTITKAQICQLQSHFTKFLRYLVKGGQSRQATQEYSRKDGSTGEFSKYVMKNAEIFSATRPESIESFINRQRTNWIRHIVQSEDSCFIKQLTFPDFYKSDKKKRGVMSTVYRQVKLIHETELKMSEAEMIEKFGNRGEN